MNLQQETDFEDWARLLLNRKVPEPYSHLVDLDTIKRGAMILRNGPGFEVHIDLQDSGAAASSPLGMAHSRGRIAVTPMPRRGDRLRV